MSLLRLFFVHALRYHARHRVLAALNIAGIALGIAVFVSIQVVNYSALESFRASVDVVAGKANFSISSDGHLLDELLYLKALETPHASAVTPVLEDVCLLPDFPGQYLHVVGIDLFSNRPFSTYTLLDTKLDPQNLLEFLTRPDHVAISETLAQKLGLKIGDRLRARATGREISLAIAAILHFSEDTPGADEHLAVMDIAGVQDTFRHPGRLSRIDLMLAPKNVSLAQAVRDAQTFLAPSLPPNLTAAPPDRRGAQIERMVGAFQLNLTALSLIALMVGMFLIYNTVSTAVVKRRAEIGLLRTLGLERWQVQALFLAEASVLGFIGILAGLALGLWLSTFLVQGVSSTITSLYLLLHIQNIFISPWSILLALFFGFSAVLAAGWHPSREAALVRPVEALSMGTLAEKASAGVVLWNRLGFLCLALAIFLCWVSLNARFPWISFGGAFFTLLGFTFFVPSVSRFVSGLYRGPSVCARLAFTHFGRSLHRNSITIAALVTALAMLLGVSIMIHSFRSTVDIWLQRAISADLFLAPASSLVVGVKETLPVEAVNAVRRHPAVSASTLYRESSTTFGNLPVKLSATDFSVIAGRDILTFLGAGEPNPLRVAIGQQAVLVSEPMALKHRLKQGDSIRLPTPTGMIDFVIVGIFKDYTTERGVILIDRALYRRYWQDDSITSVALFLKPGADRSRVQDELRAETSAIGQYLIYSNAQIREEAIRIFDQTFSVTYLLRVIAMLVAGLGIFLTLTILTAERTREIGVLRASGASRFQIIQTVLLEASLLALVGSFLGIAAGFALAAVLSYVINVAFFGWSIDWATPWPVVLQTPFWVWTVAMAAALHPAWRAAQTDIAAAVREE